MNSLHRFWLIIFSLSLYSQYLYAAAAPVPGYLSAAPVPGAQPTIPVDDFTQMLLSNLSEEEKNAVFEEAERMIQEYESLAGDEAAQQAYLEELERQAMDAERELGEALGIDPNQLPPLAPVAEAELPKEPEKPEPKETLPAVDLEQLAGVRTLLNEMIHAINNIITKTEAMPRVSTDAHIEQEWFLIKEPLLQARSFMQIIAHNDELIKPLLTDEFKLLKGQLETLRKPLIHAEQELQTSNTGGLTIVFGEEQSAKTTQATNKALLTILDVVQSYLEENQLTWGMKRLLQKYAPQELKKEEAKMAKPVATPATTSGIYVPPAPAPRPAPPMKKFPDYLPPLPPTAQPAEENEPSSIKSAKGNDGKAKGKGGKGSPKKPDDKKEKKKEKKDEKGKEKKPEEKKKGKKPVNKFAAAEKKLKELEKILQDLDAALQKANIPANANTLLTKIVTPTRGPIDINTLLLGLTQANSALSQQPARLAREFGSNAATLAPADKQKFSKTIQALTDPAISTNTALRVLLEQLVSAPIKQKIQHQWSPSQQKTFVLLEKQARDFITQHEDIKKQLAGKKK